MVSMNDRSGMEMPATTISARWGCCVLLPKSSPAAQTMPSAVNDKCNCGSDIKTGAEAYYMLLSVMFFDGAEASVRNNIAPDG